MPIEAGSKTGGRTGRYRGTIHKRYRHAVRIRWCFKKEIGHIRIRTECYNAQENEVNDNYLMRLPLELRKTGSTLLGEIELLHPLDSNEFGVVYEDKYIMLIRDRVRFPNGNEGGYIRVVNKGEIAGSAGCVLIPTWADSIFFIQIFRHATRTWEWELPRGFQEPNLSDSENVKNEVFEELGVAASSVEKIGALNANTGLLTGMIGVFAVGLEADPIAFGTPQLSESIKQIERVPISELRDFISTSKLRCGISLAALMIYLNHVQLRI